MRRNNVRAIGIPERVEGKNPVAFIESWLLTIFGKESFTPMFSVERAHRVPMSPLPPGYPPRTFLFKMLNYKDRDVILSKAWKFNGELAMDNTKISLFPDYSAEVQKLRAKFTDVKHRLNSLNLQYAMLFPAKLRVVANGEAHFFEKPSAATQWIDREERGLRARTPLKHAIP